MTSLAVLALVALPLANPAWSTALGARSELRLRVPGEQRGAGVAEDYALDSDSLVRGRLFMNTRRFQLSFGYLPRLTLRDFTHEAIREILHTAEGSATWRARRASVTLRQRVSYGDRSFSPLVSDPTPTEPDPASGSTDDPALAPEVEAQAVFGGSISYVAIETLLSAALVLSRRSGLNLSTRFVSSGGTDAPSRDTVPPRTGLGAAVGYRYTLTHTDTLVSGLDGAVERTETLEPPTVTTATFSISEEWRRQWSLATTSRVGLGVGFAASSVGDDSLRPNPLANAALRHRIITGPEHGVLELTAAAGVNNVTDRLTAESEVRGQASGSAVWHVAPLSFYAEVTRVVSLGETENELDLVTGSAGVRILPIQELLITLGARVVHQTFEPTPETVAFSGLSWATFVAVEYRMAPVSIR